MQHPEISGGEPLVPLLDEADFSPRMRRSAERVIARSGRLPNSGYALANAGDLGAATAVIKISMIFVFIEAGSTLLNIW